MKKIYALVMVLFASIALVSCVKPGPSDGNVDLVINYAVENDKRLLTYRQAEPLTMPNGDVITTGDLKPVWQEVEKTLGINIDDVAQSGQKPRDMFDLAGATQYRNANIFGGNIAEAMMNAGTNGYFVDIKQQLDKMPNFSAYLEENPLVAQSITAYDGGIYHLPYIAEIGSNARVFNGRYSWVSGLLDGKTQDGKDLSFETETNTLTVSYDSYWQPKALTGEAPAGGYRHADANVINLQNAAAVNGKLDGATALEVLVNYIKATYPEIADEPSKLYLNGDAQYDIDELVALWRVIKLHPKTLSKQATGVAKADAVIWPFFARQSNHREEFLRLQNYFGGQRVHGSDSYQSRFYIDQNGELTYSYYQDDFLNNLPRLRAIAAEGLVDERLFGPANTTNLRSNLYFADKNEATKVLGFMTFDFTSSTTADAGGQTDVIGMLPPVTTTPASDGEFIHYIDNSRTVKPEGWAIAKHTTGEQLDKALELFDYFFSDEGSRIQNYGVETLWESPDGFENPFDGVKGPKFNEWATTTANQVANGDISTFLRDHIGALISVGYQKEIGFEIQSTSENGMRSWAIFDEANGGKGLIKSSYDSEIPFYQLAPAVISLKVEEQSIIESTTGMSSATEITDLLFGYLGSKTEEGIPTNVAQVKKLLTDAKVEIYINIYKDAYARIKGSKKD